MAKALETTINIRAEVESLLGRELIGHEKAIVIHLNRQGMMNPFDIAKKMLARHIENATTRQHSIASELVSLENELKAVKAKDSKPSTALRINVSTLDRVKTQSDDVTFCRDHLAKAESLAPINMHSHGQLIDDMVESARNAYILALAFKTEVQGR